MRRMRSESFIWFVTATPAVVVTLFAVIGILTASFSGGAHTLPMPQPAPVGP